MCFILNLVSEKPKLVLYLILIGSSIAVYNNYTNKIKEEIQEASSKINKIGAVLTNVSSKIEFHTVHLENLKYGIKKLKSDIKLQRKDMTGMVDYAYGGKVISIGNTVTFTTNDIDGLSLFGQVRGQLHLEQLILDSSVTPGNCWPIKGNTGSAVIELITSIVVTHVTMEHAPKELLPHGTNTTVLKEFSLWGLHDDGRTPHFFGKFKYSMTGPEVQTFTIHYSCKTSFKNVQFEIHSNQGNEHFTCIYRLRIHGY